MGRIKFFQSLDPECRAALARCLRPRAAKPMQATLSIPARCCLLTSPMSKLFPPRLLLRMILMKPSRHAENRLALIGRSITMHFKADEIQTRSPPLLALKIVCPLLLLASWHVKLAGNPTGWAQPEQLKKLFSADKRYNAPVL